MSGAVEIRDDRWLSAIVGHGVFRIEAPAPWLAHPANVAALCDRVRAHAATQTAAMYYSKIDTERVDAVRRLGAMGFYAVDVNVTFAIDTRAQVPPARSAVAPGCAIGEVSADQEQAVLAIAGTCFRFSRFHLDPQIPTAIAHRIKHDWILNYVRKRRGECLLVAAVGGRPVGFLAVLAGEQDGRRVRTIDLVGVGTEARGRGVGRALVASFIDRYRDECDVLQVGTQVANVPSMRLYERLGFSIVKSAYVLHAHVRPEAAPGARDA